MLIQLHHLKELMVLELYIKRIPHPKTMTFARQESYTAHSSISQSLFLPHQITPPPPFFLHPSLSLLLPKSLAHILLMSLTFDLKFKVSSPLVFLPFLLFLLSCLPHEYIIIMQRSISTSNQWFLCVPVIPYFSLSH